MQNIFNMGKEVYSEYQASQQGHQGTGGGDYGVQGSADLNSPDNNRPPQVNIDNSAAVQHAANQSGQDPSLFSEAMGAVQGLQGQGGNQQIDEQGVQDAHAQAYSQGNASNLGASSMGSAAAMQALRMFTQGSSGGNASSGSGFQSQLVGQAMAEAAKLFDQSGGAADGGSKNDAVASAGQMIMKLMMSGGASGMIGGGSSGGLMSMASMASKFM